MFDDGVGILPKRFFVIMNLFVLVTLMLSSCKGGSSTKPLEPTQTSSVPASTQLPFGKGVVEGIDSEEGIDFDDITGYDYLKINIMVNVGGTGEYIIDANLHTLDGQFITFGNLLEGLGFIHSTIVTSTKLNAGTQSVPVYFSGTAIQRIKEDGPYKLGISLLNQSGVELDKTEFVTGRHQYKNYK